MIEIDKKLRRRNWPVIERAIKLCCSYLITKKTRSVMRRYYVDGIEPDFSCDPFIGSDYIMDETVRLLCEPMSTEEQWAGWVAESRETYGKGIGTLLNLHNCNFYFGSNSPFNGRDTEVYEFFYESPVIDFKEDPLPFHESFHHRRSPPNEIYATLFHEFTACKDYVSTMRVNPYRQNFLLIRDKIARLKQYADYHYGFEAEEHIDDLVQFFCPIEWAGRHPDKFDANIQPTVEYVRDFFQDEKTNPVLRQAYRETVDLNLAKYAQLTGAGGQISMCIRYDSADKLQAMLPLLYHETRYPNSPDHPEGLALALPRLAGRSYRRSYMLLTALWESGFHADRHVVLDETTLFIQFNLPLAWDKATRAIVALESDATNLVEHIESRKLLPEDTWEGETPTSELVFLLRPLRGAWRVCAWKQSYLDNRELEEGENSDIDRMVNTGGTIEDVLLTLLEQGQQIIRSEGYESRASAQLKEWGLSL